MPRFPERGIGDFELLHAAADFVSSTLRWTCSADPQRASPRGGTITFSITEASRTFVPMCTEATWLRSSNLLNPMSVDEAVNVGHIEADVLANPNSCELALGPQLFDHSGSHS